MSEAKAGERSRWARADYRVVIVLQSAKFKRLVEKHFVTVKAKVNKKWAQEHEWSRVNVREYKLAYDYISVSFPYYLPAKGKVMGLGDTYKRLYVEQQLDLTPRERLLRFLMTEDGLHKPDSPKP